MNAKKLLNIYKIEEMEMEDYGIVNPIKPETYEKMRKQFDRDLDNIIKKAIKNGWKLKDWIEWRKHSNVIAAFADYIGAK